jgi:hypothetical protein
VSMSPINGHGSDITEISEPDISIGSWIGCVVPPFPEYCPSHEWLYSSFIPQMITPAYPRCRGTVRPQPAQKGIRYTYLTRPTCPLSIHLQVSIYLIAMRIPVTYLRKLGWPGVWLLGIGFVPCGGLPGPA